MDLDLTDIIAEIVSESEEAILVRLAENWPAVELPLSMIDVSRNDPLPGMHTISMPTDLADEKGLI